MPTPPKIIFFPSRPPLPLIFLFLFYPLTPTSLLSLFLSLLHHSSPVSHHHVVHPEDQPRQGRRQGLHHSLGNKPLLFFLCPSLLPSFPAFAISRSTFLSFFALHVAKLNLTRTHTLPPPTDQEKVKKKKNRQRGHNTGFINTSEYNSNDNSLLF